MQISIIGVGHLARSIIKGLQRQNKSYQLNLINRSPLAKKDFISSKKCKITINDNIKPGTEIILLATRPADCLLALAEHLETSKINPNTIICSLCAGLELAQIKKTLKMAGYKSNPAFRVMTNLPAAQLQAMSVAFGRSSQINKNKINELFTALGELIWIGNEADLHLATVLAGSAPAYYYFIQSIIHQYAISRQISAKQAHQLATQAMLGAACALKESGQSPEDLCAAVCVPNGTTIAAINILKSNGDLAKIFNQALKQCERRSIELAKNLRSKK